MTRWILLAALFLLPSCATPSADATAVARASGMVREEIRTDTFLLTGFSRLTKQGEPLTVYIEGDGFAWRSIDEPSLNPTPHKALGLGLASYDTAANVAYIARPCQFTPLEDDPNCGSDAYWTGKRFAPEVVASINQAVSYYMAKSGAKRVHLVGYSGGAAIAALLAMSRTDVDSLRTVAGNLDTEAFNLFHGVSAMPESLNPIKIAPNLALLPQEHFVGDQDETVPPAIADSFASWSPHCATVTHVNATHEEGWLAFWPSAVGRIPVCHSVK